VARRSSWRWTLGSSEMAWSGTGRRPLPLLGGRFLRRQIGDELAEPLAKVAAVHDHVDHAVGEQIFGALKAFGELLADRRFDDALAGEADERSRLGELDVAQHGVGCGDAA